MKIQKGFELRSVCGENVITGTGLTNVNFCKLISLNGTAVEIWNKCKEGDFTIESVTEMLTSRYDVDEATAKADVIRIMDQWKELGIVAD